MKMHFMAAGALALASLAAALPTPQTASATNASCVPVANQVQAECPTPTGANPMTALWSTITGWPPVAHASASSMQPSG